MKRRVSLGVVIGLVALAGIAMTTATAQTTTTERQPANELSVTVEDDPSVEIVSPLDWQPFERSSQIPIELDLDGTDTATLSIEDTETRSDSNVTLRDTDDSGSATVYFTPEKFDNSTNGFSAGAGTELRDVDGEFDAELERLEDGVYRLTATAGGESDEATDDRIEFRLEYDRESSPGVSLSTPEAGGEFDQFDRIPIEIDLRNTDTGTVTVGNLASQNARFDATVRDTDDSGTAIVYFTPVTFDGETDGFTAGEGTELRETDSEIENEHTVFAPPLFDLTVTPWSVPDHETEFTRRLQTTISITDRASDAEIEGIERGEEFDQTDRIPIELDLSETDTATLTVGDLEIDNVHFDATVRDTDDSGTATVYFKPAAFDGETSGFSAGEGTELLDTDAEFEAGLSALAAGPYELTVSGSDEPHHEETARATDDHVVVFDELTTVATITEPAPGETFDIETEIPIELALQDTDTGTVTVGNFDEDGARFDGTIRDTDGSGSATVYFTPAEVDDDTSGFSAGAGTELLNTEAEFADRSALDPGTYELTVTAGQQPHHAELRSATDQRAVTLTAATDDDADGAGFGFAVAAVAIASLVLFARRRGR